MSDIVQELRRASNESFETNQYRELTREAADEIERLRGLLGAANAPESKTFRDMKDKIMSGMAKDLGVDHG